MDSGKLDFEVTSKFIEDEFKNQIVDGISDFIRIPNLSPYFDPEWRTNGNQEKATSFLIDYVKKQDIKGMKAEVIQKGERTSIIFIEIEASGSSKNFFLYGHFDKQPHFTGWSEGLGPTTPVIRDEKLYGRGGADDGYAIFSSLASIKAVQKQGKPHPRCVILIEGSEESGSRDLLPYVEDLKDRIGVPDFVICLDSGCLTYDTLWVTTSLRGHIKLDLKIETISEGVHSGSGGGIAVDTTMVLRNLLDRIENSKNGVIIDDFQVEIPKGRIEEMKAVAETIKGEVYDAVKFSKGVKPLSDDPCETLKNNTWKACISIVGASGFPEHKTAGNVLRPYTEVRLSMRLPPTLDGDKCIEKLEKIMTENPPFGAKITITDKHVGNGFNANPFSENLAKCLNSYSLKAFGKNSLYFGCGGSIPFIKILSDLYPKCEMLILGVLGPGSNAHTVNEFLHIPYCKKLTTIIAHVIGDCS